MRHPLFSAAAVIAAVAAAVAIVARPDPASAQSAQLQRMQQERLKFVAELRRGRIITGFRRQEDGQRCYILIGPNFSGLDFDTKQKQMSVPWTYCAAAANSTAVELAILDPADAQRQIGVFTDDGLSLLE